MRVTKVETHAAYLDYLRRTPHEASALLKDLHISVTHFFRDPAAFEALQAAGHSEALRGQYTPGRAFACGSSAAPPAKKRTALPCCFWNEPIWPQGKHTFPFQIFASDPDEEALAYGREGLYPESLLQPMFLKRVYGASLCEKASITGCAKNSGKRCSLQPHSLLKDPPFSQLDLISCRNLLIYFQRELQEQVYQLFHYALKPQGYLFLGSAEGVEGFISPFHEVDKAHRPLPPACPRPHASVRLPNLPLNTAILEPDATAEPQRGQSAAGRSPMPSSTGRRWRPQAPPSLIVNADASYRPHL